MKTVTRQDRSEVGYLSGMRRAAFVASLCFAAVLLSTGCVELTGAGDPVNPFRDLSALPLDGRARDVSTDIVPLGALEEGDVIRVEVRGGAVTAVLILIEDESTGASGLMVGGGRGNEAFQYRIPRTAHYFAFIQIDPAATARQRRATIAVEPGDPAFAPPAGQHILVTFDEGFLSDPGLFDPESQTPEDQAFLASIADQVREGIIQRLQTIFAGTPLVLSFDPGSPPDPPHSTLRFSPERVPATDATLTDSALPPSDPTRPECAQRVVFGEILPQGALLDPGNSRPDDSAIVYVGSFQGRGATCQSAAINSVNNIVLGLAQTAAHEIGHLVGLYHVPLTDIMDRSPTQAFQRELSFEPGQILIDSVTSGEITSTVLTTVKQNPELYFSSIFTSTAP